VSTDVDFSPDPRPTAPPSLNVVARVARKPRGSRPTRPKTHLESTAGRQLATELRIHLDDLRAEWGSVSGTERRLVAERMRVVESFVGELEVFHGIQSEEEEED
jgi:hypothetical protein